MSKRDDFNSSTRTATGSSMAGTSMAGNGPNSGQGGYYEYRDMGPNAMGNWNTGGTLLGRGNANAVFDDNGNIVGGSTAQQMTKPQQAAYLERLRAKNGVNTMSPGPNHSLGAPITSPPQIPTAFPLPYDPLSSIAPPRIPYAPQMPPGYVPDSGLPSFYGNSAQKQYYDRVPGATERNIFNGTYRSPQQGGGMSGGAGAPGAPAMGGSGPWNGGRGW